MGQNQALQSLRVQERHLGHQLEVHPVEELPLEDQCCNLQNLIQKLLNQASQGRLTKCTKMNK